MIWKSNRSKRKERIDWKGNEQTTANSGLVRQPLCNLHETKRSSCWQVHQQPGGAGVVFVSVRLSRAVRTLVAWPWVSGLCFEAQEGILFSFFQKIAVHKSNTHLYFERKVNIVTLCKCSHESLSSVVVAVFRITLPRGIDLFTYSDDHRKALNVKIPFLLYVLS